MTHGTDPLALPAAHLLGFGALLRGAGFLATVDHAQSFMQSVALLGPRSMTDIRRAAYAIYAPSPAMRDLFDQLFDAHFQGRIMPELGVADDSDETQINDDPDAGAQPPQPEDLNDAGEEASDLHLGAARHLRPDENATLRRFERDAPRQLPRRRTRRRHNAKRGDMLDMRRALRAATRTEGEVLHLPKRRRRTRMRPIVLLIDVSGSMKDHSDSYFRLAHALKRAGDRVEVFALGTQLTRVTQALALRNREQALTRASGLVPDWDGGTRLGETLGAFLAVPRFAGLMRGALVVTLSDGLERGSPDALVQAVTRIRRLAWGHLWLSPLAQGAGFAPQTQAMHQIAPLLDGLGSAASTQMICDHLLGWAQEIPKSAGGSLWSTPH